MSRFDQRWWCLLTRQPCYCERVKRYKKQLKILTVIRRASWKFHVANRQSAHKWFQCWSCCRWAGFDKPCWMLNSSLRPIFFLRTGCTASCFLCTTWTRNQVGWILRFFVCTGYDSFLTFCLILRVLPFTSANTSHSKLRNCLQMWAG